jgi:hypothetical protein
MKLLNRFTTIWFLILLGTATAHPQNLLTLQPIFTEADAVIEDQFEGCWRYDFFGTGTLSIQRIGDNFYHLNIPYKSASSQFEAVLTRVGNLLLLDLFPLIPETIHNLDLAQNLLRAHTFFWVTFSRDSMRLANVNYRWFYDNIVQRKITAGYTWSDINPVLTGSTNEIREFISANSSDSGFFGEGFLVTRIPSLKTPPVVQTEAQSNPNVKPANIMPISYHCTPKFPIKDGWFGGDGEISVPLRPEVTLWMFGDSLVGGKNTVSRKDSIMIANTVALMRCSSEGESNIQYYWNNAGTSHPEPIFQSFTGRYKYWPQDAFMVGNDLYAVLAKIGLRIGAAPDELFNFTHLGLTLAKIADPCSTSPDRWKIQLFPWSQIFGLQEWSLGVVDGNYLYFFVHNDKQEKSMARIPIDYIEQPEGHIEHLTEEGGWKVNTPAEQRRIMFTGDAGNSISYYKDLKEWIMVCGPGYLTNKIRIRTAPKLTGPWSLEKVVYECPEQTPGSSEYDKDNFCYEARAHSQFYDRENRKLLITYDCNVSDYSKLISNTDKYTARVIRIRLPE